MCIPVFGKERNLLNKESGLSYTITNIYNEVPKHTHNHYEFFIDLIDGNLLISPHKCLCYHEKMA